MLKRFFIVIASAIGITVIPYLIGMIPFLRIEGLPYWVGGIAVIGCALILWALIMRLYDYIKYGI